MSRVRASAARSVLQWIFLDLSVRRCDNGVPVVTTESYSTLLVQAAYLIGRR